MTKHPLSVNTSQQGLRSAEKHTKALYLRDNIFPVLSFLEKHGIDYKTVNGYSDIVEHFKKDFPFPNASDARNFELLGIETSGLANADLLRELNTDFFVEGKQIKIRPEWYEANEKQATFYTRNENDNKALDFANRFIALVQEGHEQGFLSNEALREISICNELAYFANGKIEYRAGRIYDAGDRHAQKQTAG